MLDRVLILNILMVETSIEVPIMNTELTLTHNTLPIPTGDSKWLFQQAYRQPMLSPEEERELALRYRDHNDLDAAQRLVLSNLRFVLKISYDYLGYGLPLEDIAQEGTVGLMKAVKRYEPDRGVRLVSFAVHWIRAEIYEFVIKNWRIVKVATTKAQRKLFFKLRQSKKALGWLSDDQVKYVAEELNVRPEDVAEMESRLSSRDKPFDPTPDDSEQQGGFVSSPESYLGDERYEPLSLIENWESNEVLREAIKEAYLNLNERSQDILRRRWMSESKETLDTLAKEYGVSKERVRQIERAAMDKIAKAIKEDVEI